MSGHAALSKPVVNVKRMTGLYICGEYANIVKYGPGASKALKTTGKL
jgi:hypothetical protein